MAIVAVMLCVSLSFVSFNANSEDVPGPFAERSNGYPLDKQDQSHINSDNYEILNPGGALAQTFKPGVDGKLTKISLRFDILGTNSPVSFDIAIRTTYFDGIWKPNGVAGNLITFSVIDNEVFDFPGIWQDFNLPTPITLDSATTYAIVLFNPTLTFHWVRGNSDIYADGLAWSSGDNGESWIESDQAVPIGEYELNFKTFMQTPDSGLKKVAWHPNGKYALAVAGDDTVYRYDRETITWSLEGTPNTDYIFNDIVWDDFYNEFYLVGQNIAMGRAGAYKYDGTVFTDLFNTPSPTTFYAVDTCGGYGDYNFLAVGEDSGGYGYAAWHHDTLGWVEVSSGWPGGFPEQLHAVAWNQRDTAATYHYAVGVDDEGDGFIYRFQTGSTVATLLYGQDNLGAELEPGYAISWNPQYLLGASYDYALIGTEPYYGFGNCYKFDGTNPAYLISKNTVPIYDIGWHPDGEHAVLVGGNPGTGTVYHHSKGSSAIVDLSDEIPGSPDTFYGVAVKGPTSPSSGIVIGSSGGFADYVDASNIDTQITVNVAYPKLFWIGFNDTAHNSKIEQQVPPDEWYEFSFAANYSLGWTECEVIVQAWYDGGALGDTSEFPAGGTEDNRCLAFSLIYDPSGPFYSMTYPGIPEYAIGGVNDAVVPGGAAGEEIHNVTLAVRLGPQIRFATGNDFISGDPDTDAAKANTLLDANSWDFNITVRDSTNNVATTSMYSEFGINKAVSISVTGNPTGNAPPGSNDMPMGNPSQITYSTNSGYWVNVSVPDLLENGVGPLWIDADNVAVANANVFADPQYTEINATDNPFGTKFTGPGQYLCVWGNRTEPQVHIDAPSNGSVSFGPFGSDFNAAWTGSGGSTTTQLNWWVTVPGATAEGIYQAKITITIEAEGG